MWGEAGRCQKGVTGLGGGVIDGIQLRVLFVDGGKVDERQKSSRGDIISREPK
jgi:hypothetical protein